MTNRRQPAPDYIGAKPYPHRAGMGYNRGSYRILYLGETVRISAAGGGGALSGSGPALAAVLPLVYLLTLVLESAIIGMRRR